MIPVWSSTASCAHSPCHAVEALCCGTRRHSTWRSSRRTATPRAVGCQPCHSIWPPRDAQSTAAGLHPPYIIRQLRDIDWPTKPVHVRREAKPAKYTSRACDPFSLPTFHLIAVTAHRSVQVQLAMVCAERRPACVPRPQHACSADATLRPAAAGADRISAVVHAVVSLIVASARADGDGA